MTRARIRHWLTIALLLAGGWQLASAAWIHVKAALAQVLLRDALEASLRDGAAHRPWPWADTWPVARLSAPGLQVDLVVLAGFSGQALAFGPGMVRDPGGALVLSGHRDTHFRFLRRVAVGDRLAVHPVHGPRREYRVTGLSVRDYRDRDALAGADGDSVVLVTCWPFEALDAGGPLRLVVHARAAAPES